MSTALVDSPAIRAAAEQVTRMRWQEHITQNRKATEAWHKRVAEIEARVSTYQ